METQHAAEIWSTLVPGGAIAFHAALESGLDSVYGSGCETSTLLYVRTASFLLCWGFGLAMMKWSGFSHGRFVPHAIVNVLVVTCWLLAISRYPLECYLGHIGTSTYDVNAVESRSVGLVRLFLLAVIEAASAFEILSYAANYHSSTNAADRSAGGRIKNNVAHMMNGFGFSSAAEALDSYDANWRKLIPATALTFQATLASSIESAFATVGALCTLEQQIWRCLTFGCSMAIGVSAMISTESIKDRKQLVTRSVLILVWLLSVSSSLVECLFSSAEGLVRLACTFAVVGITIWTMKTEEDSLTTADAATEPSSYGAIP